jgi:hypothetical protein
MFTQIGGDGREGVSEGDDDEIIVRGGLDLGKLVRESSAAGVDSTRRMSLTVVMEEIITHKLKNKIRT